MRFAFGQKPLFVALFLLVILIELPAAHLAFASGTLDQENTHETGAVFFYTTPHDQFFTQVITAGLTGYVSEVDLAIGRYETCSSCGNVTIEIHANSPTGPLLASQSESPTFFQANIFASLPPLTAITFKSPAPVFSGNSYAIDVKTSNANGNTLDAYLVGIDSSDSYGAGCYCDGYGTTDGVTWVYSPYDFTFRTYVQVTNFIMLEQGWNLVSVPVVPANPNIATILKPILVNVTTVWSYSAATKTWSFFKPGPPASGTLKTMTDGNGYWIYVTHSGMFNVTGSIFPAPPATPPSYSLSLGWNLIGFKPQPTVGNETVGQYLASINGDYQTTSVFVYDNLNGTYIRADASYMLSPGQGMWIYMTAPALLRP